MQVTKTFKLTFDEPNPHWLCSDNLKLALEQVCTNTEFKVEEMSCGPPWAEWPAEDLTDAGVHSGVSIPE